MNAKEELIRHIQDRIIKCAIIYTGIYNDNKTIINLSIQYTEDQWADFLNAMNFEYDSGFGGQELFGTIWYEDGSWSSRKEYDGSERWQHNTCPEIPEELTEIVSVTPKADLPYTDEDIKEIREYRNENSCSIRDAKAICDRKNGRG